MNATVQTVDPPYGPWLYGALAFVGGFGDAAGFVLARAFTGHATGNLVLGAIATAAGEFRVAFIHFSAVVAFLIGVFTGAWMMRPLGNSRLSTAMTVELILILASPFLLPGHLAGGQPFVICVSLALGLQNGAFRRAGGMSVHTTYLTGMITSLISSEAEKYSAVAFSPAASAHNPKIALTVKIWTIFVFGALTGAAVTFHFKQWGMLGIGLILLVLILGSRFAATNPQRT